MFSRGAGVLNHKPSIAKQDVFADLSALNGPRYLLTVDTEEEFDWSGPFTRDQHGTTHVQAIQRFQAMCEAHSAVPVYLIDYPIVNDGAAVELLAGFAARGTGEIGVQLHPWVNPPFSETLSVYNSFACNLSAELEREKLTILYEKIIERFGSKPDIYRAGRYGAGPNTPAILSDLGMSLDTSVRSRFNYSNQNGPDYSNYPVNPYWIVPGELLELPVTTVYAGQLRNMGNPVFQRMFSSEPSRAILSRTGLLERIALTPEGIPLNRAIAGINSALHEGIGILNFSFHSPSLAAGHTCYTRNEKELATFYTWWEGVFAHLALNNVKAISASQIRQALIG